MSAKFVMFQDGAGSSAAKAVSPGDSTSDGASGSASKNVVATAGGVAGTPDTAVLEFGRMNGIGNDILLALVEALGGDGGLTVDLLCYVSAEDFRAKVETLSPLGLPMNPIQKASCIRTFERALKICRPNPTEGQKEVTQEIGRAHV